VREQGSPALGPKPIVEVEARISNWYKAPPGGLVTPVRVRVARTGQAWVVSVEASVEAQWMTRTFRRPTIAVAVVIDTGCGAAAGRSVRASDAQAAMWRPVP
jgi:hypothetical protein